MNYGCLGINDKTKEIVHYVEKPSSFVSNHINAGVYLLSSEVFDDISMIFKERYSGRSFSRTLSESLKPCFTSEIKVRTKNYKRKSLERFHWNMTFCNKLLELEKFLHF